MADYQLTTSDLALFESLKKKMDAFADSLTPDERFMFATIMGVDTSDADVQTYSYIKASQAARAGDYAQQRAWTNHARNQWAAGDWWGSITSHRR